MILYEFDEEEYKSVMREDAYAEGKIDSILVILKRLGNVPDSLYHTLFHYSNDELDSLLVLALNVNTPDEFWKKMKSVCG